MRSVWRGSWWVSWALLFASSFVLAGERDPHTIRGTVVRVEKTRLDVKGGNGTAVAFVLTENTMFRRGETSISRSDLKVGEPVAVEFEEGGQAKTAIRVRAGASQPTTVYTCPMHPEVVSDRSGKCPKCGMTLEPKTRMP